MTKQQESKKSRADLTCDWLMQFMYMINNSKGYYFLNCNMESLTQQQNKMSQYIIVTQWILNMNFYSAQLNVSGTTASFILYLQWVHIKCQKLAGHLLTITTCQNHFKHKVVGISLLILHCGYDYQTSYIKIGDLHVRLAVHKYKTVYEQYDAYLLHQRRKYIQHLLSGRALAQELRGLRFKPLPRQRVVEVSSSLTSSSCCSYQHHATEGR